MTRAMPVRALNELRREQRHHARAQHRYQARHHGNTHGDPSNAHTTPSNAHGDPSNTHASPSNGHSIDRGNTGNANSNNGNALGTLSNDHGTLNNNHGNLSNPNSNPSNVVSNHEEASSVYCCGCLSRGRRGTKYEPRCYLVVLIVVQCVLLIGFLMYDLAVISAFERRYEHAHRHTFGASDDEPVGGSGDDGSEYDDSAENKDKDDDELESSLREKYAAYQRQEAVGLAVLLLLISLVASAVLLGRGYRHRKPALCVPFLLLSFPALTAAMVYAILFKVDDRSVIVYVKIITIVVIYTVMANVYRVVYREYHAMKQNPRSLRQPREIVPSITLTVGPPVRLQMKPPPYEKEPPAYSLTHPDITAPAYTEQPLNTGTVDGNVESVVVVAQQNEQNMWEPRDQSPGPISSEYTSVSLLPPPPAYSRVATPSTSATEAASTSGMESGMPNSVSCLQTANTHNISESNSLSSETVTSESDLVSVSSPFNSETTNVSNSGLRESNEHAQSSVISGVEGASDQAGTGNCSPVAIDMSSLQTSRL